MGQRCFAADSDLENEDYQRRSFAFLAAKAERIVQFEQNPDLSDTERTQLIAIEVRRKLHERRRVQSIIKSTPLTAA